MGSGGYESVLTPKNNVLQPMGKSIQEEAADQQNVDSTLLKHANSAYEDLAVSTLPNATSPDPTNTNRHVHAFDPGMDTDRDSKSGPRTNNNFFSTDEGAV